MFTTSVAAGQSYSFKPFSDDEKKYLVEVTKDAGKGGDDRFLDGKNYIIYRFPVSAHDKYAQFTAKIGAQYKISASVDNVNYKVMEEAVKPADAKPDWGANRELRNVNVSEFITAYDGYIYIKIEDAQNDNGWGPYIVTANGIKFTTIAPVGLQKLVDVESIDAQAGFSENESAPSIFDGNSKTKYCLPNPTPVITWKMKEAVSVGSYKFTTANDSPERTPKSWTFYGSNDGTTWTVLSKIEGAAMPTDFFTDSKSYIVNNHDKFTFFKLEITSVFGGDLCQFSEFKFFPAP